MSKPGEEYEHIVAALHRQFADDATVTEDETLLCSPDPNTSIARRSPEPLQPAVIPCGAVPTCRDVLGRAVAEQEG